MPKPDCLRLFVGTTIKDPSLTGCVCSERAPLSVCRTCFFCKTMTRTQIRLTAGLTSNDNLYAPMRFAADNHRFWDV